MARESLSLLALTVTATGALTAHRFVGHDGAIAAAGASALGVARTAAAVGEAVACDTHGTALVEAGAAIVAGAAIEVGTDGKAATLNLGDKVGRLAPGSSAAADGDLVEVILINN